MQYYFAPMEGITGYPYRRVWHRIYGDADKVFMPFLSPTQNGRFGANTVKELRDERLSGIPAIPQIIANNADNFIWAARDLGDIGYDEINLNLGCPSATVVSKHKGAGFLGVPDDLDAFLDAVYSALPELKISIKTRLGMADDAEFVHLLEIYNKYPVHELIIHARVRSDFYKGAVRMDAFDNAVKHSAAPLCYNGDIFTADDASRFAASHPAVQRVMIGRGLLADPGLIRGIKTGERTDRAALRLFHDELCDEFRASFSGDVPVLHKMKEIWFYMGRMFVDDGKYIKAINKARSMTDYKNAVSALFSSAPMAAAQSVSF